MDHVLAGPASAPDPVLAMTVREMEPRRSAVGPLLGGSEEEVTDDETGARTGISRSLRPEETTPPRKRRSQERASLLASELYAVRRGSARVTSRRRNRRRGPSCSGSWARS